MLDSAAAIDPCLPPTKSYRHERQYMIEEVLIYVSGGTHDATPNGSQAMLLARFGSMDRCNWPVGLCIRIALRANRQAAGGRQGVNAMEISPRRRKDRRYPSHYQVSANHLREVGASVHPQNPRLRRHVRRATE